MANPNSPTYDYVIIGSGFGGSVSAIVKRQASH
jgi:choline dehydrogenase-like flavoprotein